jgi:exodeoxyribonuclease VII large subunit
LEAYSLYEVNQYIKRVLALNFEEPLWIECELNSVSNSRGNLYLDLIEKDENSDDIIAKASATIWYRQFLFIKKKLKDLTDSILSPGVKVKLKGNIVFSERYGLSFNIIDIDPAFTFGQFEMNRQKIIDKLKSKDLIDVNAYVPLPSVIQNIAVISSETAAGYQDFVSQLSENAYGYDYNINLYQAAMQGQKTEREVVAALQAAKEDDNHIITIIRGGGSKLDLSAFDNYNIAFEIATSPLPVLTGIGHDIDMTVSDIVAHQVLKTPTAVADFLIEHNSQFEGEILLMMQNIEHEAQQILDLKHQEILLIQEKLTSIPTLLVQQYQHDIESAYDALLSQAEYLLKDRNKTLDNYTQLLEMTKPKNVLKRGFALVKSDDKYISKQKDIKKSHKDLTIEFYDGEIQVTKHQ